MAVKLQGFELWEPHLLINLLLYKTWDQEDQKHFLPFLPPSLTILFLFFTPGSSLWFFCPPFALTWKDNAIVHVSQAIAKGSNPSYEWLLYLPWCWSPCSSAHRKFLPNFQYLSFYGTNSAPSLSCPFPCLWLTIPNLGTCIQDLYKEKGNQSKIACVAYRPLNCMGLHDCHFSSHGSQTQMEMTRKHSWFKISFLW